MKIASLVLLAGTTATLAQDYGTGESYQAPASSYGGESYGSGSSGSEYDSSSYKAPSDYGSGSPYSSSGSGYGEYPQEKSAYSYDKSMPSYGKSSEAFIDAWFTFNKKTDKIMEVKNSGARVTVKKGENAQIILEGIFEDDNDFAKANMKGGMDMYSSSMHSAKNVNCANKKLTYYEKEAGCVTDYNIGVEFATGSSTKKYSGYSSKNKLEPSVVTLNSYGYAPVTTPAVKLTCHEVRSAEPTTGAFGEWNDLRTTVATKKIKAAYFNNFLTNTVDEEHAFEPPIFSEADYKACWHARGAPHTERVGTCLKDVSGDSAAPVDNIGPLYSTYPCFPVATSKDNIFTVGAAGNAGGKFNCPFNTEADYVTPINQYCSSVVNLGGCFPGCKAGEPEDAPTAIAQNGKGTAPEDAFINGKLFLAGHCGWPREAACVNKPRAIKCTAVIEVGFAAAQYEPRPSGYGRDSRYKIQK